MAHSLHALGCILCCKEVQTFRSSTSYNLAVTPLKSLHFCCFKNSAAAIFGRLSCICSPGSSTFRVSQRLQSQSMNAMHNGVEPSDNLSLQEAKSAVEQSLIATGFCHEDAAWVSENAPSFIQKLMEEPGEPDELDRWAKLSTPAEAGDPGPSGSDEAVNLSNRKQWAAVLESVGVREQNVSRVSHVLSSSSLPEFLKKVRFVEDILSRSQIEGQTLERKVHQMMLRLSVAADEDLQHTLSFFEKVVTPIHLELVVGHLVTSLLQMEAQRGGIALLQSAPFAIARLIEEFPQIFLRDLDSEIRPAVTFLETLGVPEDALGRVVLLFPPTLLSEDDRNRKARMRTFTKVGVRSMDLGKMISRYPWLLSRTAQNNFNEVVEFLFSIKVPGGKVDQSITKCPQLVGCSPSRTLQPMVERINDLGVKSKRLGRLIACSPQLLVRTPGEFNEVVNFLSKLGVEPKDMGGMLKRSPEVFASDVTETLETKVQFLQELGIKDELVWRVLRMFPEMLSMSVNSLERRMQYLRDWNLSKSSVAIMVCRFPPLLGYNIESVLQPKLRFLVKTMGRQVYEVVDYPRYFSYSLEKKILPRARVIERRKISCDLKTMLAKTDDEFAAEFLGLGRMLIPPL